jgi:hypothetical protein
MFEDRIFQATACEAIDLNETESEIYHGAGWAIAHVEKDQIIKFVYLNFEIGNEETEAEAAIKAALEHGEAWFGMCSCYQFCEPRQMTLNDPTLFARIMRLSVYDESEE